MGEGGCTVIVINKNNGSHSAHKRRQTGQEGGEGRGVRDRGGKRGGQDAMGCALLGLNEEKQLSHTPPPTLEIKKTSKIIETPLPHILKNNNTVAAENGKEGKWTQ